MQPAFVHLHLHSEYSLVDGIVRVEPLVEAAVQSGMPALAATEQGNLFSLVKLYQEAGRRGIKPIAGAELRVAPGGPAADSSSILLLVQNQEGYRNLTRLITRSYFEGRSQDEPLVRREWLEGSTAGLIALSCARDGDVGQALVNGNGELAKTLLAEWLELFPDRYYLELQRTRRPHEDLYIDGAVKLADGFNVPVVATNDVRFLRAEDFEAHEARVCIHEGRTLGDSRRERRYSPEQYLKGSAEMAELFRDLPEAVENTLLIAQRCNLGLELGKYFLPDFPVPERHNQDSWLRHEAAAGLARILDNPGPAPGRTPAAYSERLAMELGVIVSMGFAGYFLIVADFIRWAKGRGIPVGPGRGSGAGSLVAYALDITELDPLRYDLLFERFLNPERVSLPDFDIDFCMDRRDEVIDYVAGRYGRDRVSQIITYGSMAAKAVVRDVGRVLGHPYGFVDKLAKLIPFELNMTLDRALDQEDALRQRYEQEEEVRAIIDLARKLEGLARNAGRHAGGIVIAPRPLTDYMPLYCEAGGQSVTTQFDMGDVEAIGLVKFDFLGLRTLTIIDSAVKDVNLTRVASGGGSIDIRRIPLDDPPTYELIRRTDTTAIFQLESDGMRKLIRRLRPDSFDDLIALVALFRPGPLQSGMVDDFVERKHGKQRVQYPHPALEPILKPTYGVILYQEQVMEIAQVLAGYTLGSADLLRRAMGKKKPEEMAKQRSVFMEGAAARGVNTRLATGIFDLMEKFAGYGFNKSHSAAYALLAYQTAWLKAHFPAAFMAAVLSSDMDNTDKIMTLREEVRTMGLQLLPPSVNESAFRFQVVDPRTIRFGLGAIKGVGASAVESILEERGLNGAFGDFFEFVKRIDTRRVNKRVLEALVRSGATDGLGPSRSAMFASLDRALQFAEQHAADSSTGQTDMFGLAAANGLADAEAEVAAPHPPFIMAADWSEQERLTGEKETLGFYLRGHPISRYESELAGIISVSLQDLRPGNITIAGYVDRIRSRSGMRGRMAELRLEDRTARAHVTLYSETYERYRQLLAKDQLLIVKGEAVEDDFLESGISVIARELFSLDQIRRQARLRLRLAPDIMQNGAIQETGRILAAHRSGTCSVSIEYNNDLASGNLQCGASWRVVVSDRLLEDLRAVLGDENVSVLYS
jgi:DNA polymerase-3 subunit alpha